MLKITKLNVQKQEEKQWPLCPEYVGVAKVVDSTELKEYQSDYGPKQKFRLLIELNQAQENGKNWVVSSAPFTLSLHEKSGLYKFCKSAGFDPDAKGFSLEQLVGKPINVVIAHNEVDGKTYANIAAVTKAKSDAPNFTTTYTPKEA